MKLAYLDSCVWIVEVEGLSCYQHAINLHLQTLIENGWTFCTSDVVRLEVLIKPLISQQPELVRTYTHLLGKLTHLKTYSQVFIQALQLAQTEHLKAMDALHVALAVHYRCQLFVSSDPGFRTLNSITPDWIDLSGCLPSVSLPPS